jgi:O-antigen/teichoic acid export membrane protein
MEYIWFFVVSYYATKQQFGEFELYKKIIEFASVIVSLGFPGLIITFSKNLKQKNDFFLAGAASSIILSVVLGIIGYLIGFNYLFLIIPILFFSLFHYSNSIYQAYNLVVKGSRYTSNYKNVVSVLFSIAVLGFFFSIEEKEMAIVYSSYPLIIIGIIYFMWDFDFGKLKSVFFRVSSTIKEQYYNGTVIFITTLVNTSFLATDIFIISYFAGTEDTRLADYSFPLMVASALFIIPRTFTSVDVEDYKLSHDKFKKSAQKIFWLCLLAGFGLVLFYFGLINTLFEEYKNTFAVFLVILLAKLVQSITVPYGVYLGTKGIFTYQLKVLITSLGFNVICSILVFDKYDLMGIAVVSLIGITIRLIFYYLKYRNGRDLY